MTWIQRATGSAAVLALLFVSSAAFAQDTTFTGSWDSTYGRLVLEQDGDSVEGSYSYGGGSSVEGTVEGNRLTFRYQEPAASGEGWFELSDDGASLNGQWREDGTQQWYPWTATRSSSFHPSQLTESVSSGWSGLFDTTYGRLRLVRSGDTVTGSYSYSGGSSVEGTVEGNRLTFRYTEPNAAGEGWFELSEDESSFDGQWRADGSQEWQAWTGERIEPEQGVIWLVVLEAQWEYSIAEEEYSFGEMLETYFARYPNVNVRQRRINDREDFQRASRELSYLAEPAVVLLSSHGSMGQLQFNEDQVGADDVQALLAGAPNVFLLHFSSCEIMVGNNAQTIMDGVPSDRPLTLSGYAVSVDWSASALLEFLYLDLVLGRGFAPDHAARLVEEELSFASDMGTPGSPLGGASFRVLSR